MKKLTAILSLALVVCMLAGCAGTTVVYYSDCTCPVGSHVQTPATEAPATEPPVVAEGAVKTGLAVVTTVRDSVSASADAEGEAKYDVTVAAVNVDDNGVITACYIDSIGASVMFGADGVITSDVAAAVLTKNELGDSYGMKAYAGAKYEWYEQAAALADYAVGKTVEELRSGAVNESGKAADADLASTATIYLGGYVDAIEKAVANAKHLGAQAGDELKIGVLASREDSYDSTLDKNGNAQLNVDVTAISMAGDIITSCVLDSVQAKCPFGGKEEVEEPESFPTKNELGEAYGMKAWGGAAFEWNEQAANFAAYVTGKTAAEVAGIAIDEGTKPTDADLSASVTIAIGGFQALIAKACQ